MCTAGILIIFRIKSVTQCFTFQQVPYLSPRRHQSCTTGCTIVHPTITPKFHISALYVQGAPRVTSGERYGLGWIGCVRGCETFPGVVVSKSVMTGFPGLDLGCPKLFLERYTTRSSRTFQEDGFSASALATSSSTDGFSSLIRIFSGLMSCTARKCGYVI